MSATHIPISTLGKKELYEVCRDLRDKCERLEVELERNQTWLKRYANDIRKGQRLYSENETLRKENEKLKERNAELRKGGMKQADRESILIMKKREYAQLEKDISFAWKHQTGNSEAYCKEANRLAREIEELS